VAARHGKVNYGMMAELWPHKGVPHLSKEEREDARERFVPSDPCEPSAFVKEMAVDPYLVELESYIRTSKLPNKLKYKDFRNPVEKEMIKKKVLDVLHEADEPIQFKAFARRIADSLFPWFKDRLSAFL
jgi:hypothetical protein